MSETLKKCPLCGQEKYRHFATVTFRGAKVVNQICENCGLVFQSPRMTESELNDYYAREYRQIYQGDEGPTPKDLRTQKGRALSLLEFMKGSVPKVDRHLDVGCSAGILLEEIRDQYGSQPIGVEPGESYRKFAQDKGITVYSDLADLKKSGEQRFDFVSMGHVLEHFADPVAYLSDLRASALTSQAWLLIEVPNLYAHDSFETAHMTSFSQHTLTQTLQKAGFKIIKIKAHGQPRSELIPLYLTVLGCVTDKPADHSVRPEKNVALKRKIGLLRRKIIQRLSPAKAWKPVN